jgi:hypothetical protein
MAHTQYIEIFTLETQTRKKTTTFLESHLQSSIHHIFHCLQYNIHIGFRDIQTPNPLTHISQQL